MAITLGGTVPNITFSDSTTQSTSSIPGPSVTSAVAGNGVAVSGATGAVTFSAACPAANTVGSYAAVAIGSNASTTFTVTFGSNYAAGSGNQQLQAGCFSSINGITDITSSNSLSGTWKYLGPTVQLSFAFTFGGDITAIACRVS
jgi:hypothetical protein